MSNINVKSSNKESIPPFAGAGGAINKVKRSWRKKITDWFKNKPPVDPPAPEAFVNTEPRENINPSPSVREEETKVNKKRPWYKKSKKEEKVSSTRKTGETSESTEEQVIPPIEKAKKVKPENNNRPVDVDPIQTPSDESVLKKSRVRWQMFTSLNDEVNEEYSPQQRLLQLQIDELQKNLQMESDMIAKLVESSAETIDVLNYNSKSLFAEIALILNELKKEKKIKCSLLRENKELAQDIIDLKLTINQIVKQLDEGKINKQPITLPK